MISKSAVGSQLKLTCRRGNLRRRRRRRRRRTA